MLTGTLWDTPPGAGSAVLGGTDFGLDRADDLFGYGCPRLIEPPEVVTIATDLAALDMTALVDSVALDALNAARPYPGYDSWSDDGLTEVTLPALLTLQDAYARAARHDQALMWVLR